MKSLLFFFSTLILLSLAGTAIGQTNTTLTSLVTPDNNPHTFYVTADHHIHHLQWSSLNGWQNEDVTVTAAINERQTVLAATGTPLTSVLQAGNGMMHVFYFDTRQHVNHMWLNGTWGNEDLSAFPGCAAPAADSPLAAVGLTTDGLLHVFYIGTDRHICRLYWPAGGGFANQDFTVLGAGAATGPGSKLASLVTSHGDPHIFYLDALQHVNDMHRGGGGDYGNADLTALTGNTLAAAGTPFAVLGATTDGAAHVFYLGTDNHIYRLYWPAAGGFANQDFTALGSGVAADPGSGLSAFITASGDPHVFYLDANQHINDVHRGSGGDYGNADLTAVTGNTTAAPGSPLASLGAPGGGTAYIFYVAGNGDVDGQVWPTSGGSLHNTDLAAITPGASIPTWHGDSTRRGLNDSETALTPANVDSSTFGKLFSYLVDGYMYAQPLYVAHLTIGGVQHNVVFAATERASIYAFDADVFGKGTPLWKVSLLQSGESPQPGGNPQPFQGLTSTPAIDLATNTMYAVSSQQSSGGAPFFRLHALDITTGQERAGSPIVIKASVPGTNSDSVNGVITLTPKCLQRAALLLSHGTLYLGFSACPEGWLVSYDAASLTQLGVLNMSPNVDGYGQFGGAGGVWMGGGGPADDDQGNVYISTGNGFYDGGPEWGDSVLKLDSSLHVLDNFTPQDWSFLQCTDKDMSAGGIMMLPGESQMLLGGKAGKMYLVNSSGMGGVQANDAGAAQTFWLNGNHGTGQCVDNHGNTVTGEFANYSFYATAAWFNGSAYISGDPGGVRQLIDSGGVFSVGPEAPDAIAALTYGTTPFISANGTSNGIVWALDHGEPIQAPNSSTPTAAVLRAYDPADVTHELYNSSQNPADVPGFGIKFTSPIVANGKVFVGTAHDSLSTTNPRGELDVYGLKP